MIKVLLFAVVKKEVLRIYWLYGRLIQLNPLHQRTVDLGQRIAYSIYLA